MTSLSFCKMHGLGNDFVVIDTFRQQITTPLPLTALADRHTGIGFDQLLLLGPSATADVDCQIYNADGSVAEQCGNGMRCIARYMHEEQIITKSTLTIATQAGLIKVIIKGYDHIVVNMGVPVIAPDVVSVMLDSQVALTALSLGNPHAIHRVSVVDNTPVALWGAIVESQSAFLHGVNVGFMQVVDRHHIRLRTFERGVGETRACGSNACAAVVTGIQQGWLDTPVKVQVAAGTLEVEWLGSNQAVTLTGPATRVFDGEFVIPVCF